MKYLLVIVLLFTFLVADNDNHEKENHYKKEHYYSKDLSYLQLKSEQKKRVKKILKKYRKELKKYSKLKKEVAKKKQELFLSDSFDEDNIENLNEELLKESSEIEADFLESMYEVLNKSQREKFVNFIYEWEVE